jgi:hypothetical protein
MAIGCGIAGVGHLLPTSQLTTPAPGSKLLLGGYGAPDVSTAIEDAAAELGGIAPAHNPDPEVASFRVRCVERWQDRDRLGL